MAGKNCVAVAVDKRFGSGPQTIHISPRAPLVEFDSSLYSHHHAIEKK